VHGGYNGASDAELLAIPYARLIQEARLAAERAEHTSAEAWVHSAFIGWQVSGVMGAKVGNFQKYLKQLGIRVPKEQVTREQVELDKQRAFRALELVESRFDKGR